MRRPALALGLVAAASAAAVIPLRASAQPAADVSAPDAPTPAVPTPNTPTPEAPTPDPAADLLESLPPALRARLAADFLTPDERRTLRLRHGVWTADDLQTPAQRARAALDAGALWDVAILNPAAAAAADAPNSVDPADLAEAALRRGQPDAALAFLPEDQADAPPRNQPSLRALRIRAAALLDLGDRDAAQQTFARIVERLSADRITDADELAEGVRALTARARLLGSGQQDAGDYRTLASLLARARDELDPLSWRVRLAEAELLYEKHNLGEARAAALEALARHPRCAEALELLGRMAVDAFDLPAVERAATELGTLARALDPAPDAVNPADGTAPTTPAGELLRARALLRERLADDAAAAVERALARAPGLRPGLALRAATAAARYDTPATDAALAAYEQACPGGSLAHFEAASALAEARQYDDAVPHFDRAQTLAPNYSAPWIEQGLMFLQSGDDDGALRALSRAVALDPFNLRAQNSLKLARELATFEVIESEHFRVRFRPGIDALLAAQMPGVLEEIHARVAGPDALDHAPAVKTTIELMPDHDTFAVRISGMPALHTMAAATGSVIAMEAPRPGPRLKVGAYDWPRVLQHEYVHTVTLSRTRNRIPHWFTEAAAVFYEGGPRSFDTWQLLRDAFARDELFDLRTINTAFVRPKKPTDRAQAYAQGHWMYQFIEHRWGRPATLALMDLYAQGIPEAAAFERVLGVPADAFLADFQAWAQADLRSHGLLPPPGTPTLAELVELDFPPGPDGQPAMPGPEELASRVRAWLEEYPTHPDLLRLAAADAARRAPGTDDSIGLLQRLARACPVDDLPHRELARVSLDRADAASSTRAIEHLVFLDDREEYTPVYAERLALLLAERARWPEALFRAERATRIDPFNPRLRELAARIALAAAQPAEAERHIAALTLLEPDRPEHARRLDAVRARLAPPAAP